MIEALSLGRIAERASGQLVIRSNRPDMCLVSSAITLQSIKPVVAKMTYATI